MDFIYIGDIVNTHGIKGEVRILSDFKYKEAVFKSGFTFYVGRNYDALKVEHYRRHKNYDQVVFEGIYDINEIIVYKGDKVFVKRSDLNITDVLNEDIIGLAVIVDGFVMGTVSDIMKSKAHEILVIKGKNKKYLVHYIDEFVENIDLKKQEMVIKKIGGLFDEN